VVGNTAAASPALTAAAGDGIDDRRDAAPVAGGDGERRAAGCTLGDASSGGAEPRADRRAAFAMPPVLLPTLSLLTALTAGPSPSLRPSADDASVPIVAKLPLRTLRWLRSEPLGGPTWWPLSASTLAPSSPPLSGSSVDELASAPSSPSALPSLRADGGSAPRSASGASRELRSVMAVSGGDRVVAGAAPALRTLAACG